MELGEETSSPLNDLQDTSMKLLLHPLPQVVGLIWPRRTMGLDLIHLSYKERA